MNQENVLINFYQGLYNASADQEAYQYITKLIKALKQVDMATVQEVLPQFYEMENRLNKASGLPYLADEEKTAVENAYKVPVKPKHKGSGNLYKKVSENTRFRSEISRSHGNVTGKELDKVIDEMSDEEILDVLSSGDSYGQDYRSYIEENPQEQSAMIKNIKNALKQVGVYTGAGIITNKVIRGNGKRDFSKITKYE
jgi:predicted AAA+ superfamily ATPase